MRFDTIVVPRGAEARAVEQGWVRPHPEITQVPAGAASGERLTTLVAATTAATALVLGVCGAIDPALRVGDTVVYARIVDGSQTVVLDPELAAACALALDCAPVTAATVGFVVGDVASKSELRASTGAAIVDMEGASIARVLHRRGVRVAMVRVVSDDAAHDLPDLRNVYDGAGSLRPAALAAALIRTPRRSARFISNALRALQALRATAMRLSLNPAVRSALH